MTHHLYDTESMGQVTQNEIDCQYVSQLMCLEIFLPSQNFPKCLGSLMLKAYNIPSYH